MNVFAHWKKNAARYDWLRKHGMQSYAIRFDENTFAPQPQLLEFMGLSETENDQLRAMTTDAKQNLVDWELANAQCTADTPTNCVYELPPLPEEYKERFIQQLSTLFNPEDMATLNPIVDKLYKSMEDKRTVSVTYISKDEYLRRTEPRFRSSYVPTNGMLELKVQVFDENGNSRSSSSSMFSVDHVNTEHGLQARWAHLFKYGEETQ